MVDNIFSPFHEQQKIQHQLQKHRQELQLLRQELEDSESELQNQVQAKSTLPRLAKRSSKKRKVSPLKSMGGKRMNLGTSHAIKSRSKKKRDFRQKALQNLLGSVAKKPLQTKRDLKNLFADLKQDQPKKLSPIQASPKYHSPTQQKYKASSPSGLPLPLPKSKTFKITRRKKLPKLPEPLAGLSKSMNNLKELDMTDFKSKHLAPVKKPLVRSHSVDSCISEVDAKEVEDGTKELIASLYKYKMGKSSKLKYSCNSAKKDRERYLEYCYQRDCPKFYQQFKLHQAHHQQGRC